MKIACLFPGYGSQYVGMGKSLYDDHRIVQEYFDQASRCIDKNFVKLCFASSDTDIGRVDNAYTALFVLGYSVHGLLKQEGISFDCLAGYNIGLYGALAAAGGFNFPDGLYLLNKFALFYDQELRQLSVDALHIVNINVEQVESWCDQASSEEKYVSVAVYNTAQDCIVAGHTDAVVRIRQLALDNNAEVQDMPVEVGLHNLMMKSAVDQYKVYLEKADFKAPEVKVFGGDAVPIDSAESMRLEVTRSLVEPVRWYRTMQELKEYDLIVQVGPGSHVIDLVKNLYSDKMVIAINSSEDVKTLKKLVGIEPQTEI